MSTQSVTVREATAMGLRRDGATYRVIGHHLGVSLERARHLVHSGVQKQMRQPHPFDVLMPWTRRAVLQLGFTAVQQFESMTDDEILDLRGMGRGMLREIRVCCAWERERRVP